MAVTVTTRPSTWSAIKNPTVYKFSTTGGPFVNYRIEVEVFKASDNTSLTGGVKFSFTPDKNNVTYADISTIVKAYLKAEWIKPAALNEKESDTSLKFYIKYQELYDGSATSVVDDVANPRYAVFGALQIPLEFGVEGMARYVPANIFRKFLSIFDRPKLWRGYPATLSFIFPDGLAAVYVYRAQYNSAGTIIGNEDYDELAAANDDAVNRLDLNNAFTLDASAKTLNTKLALHGVGAEELTNPSFVTSLSPWTNEAFGGSVDDWTWDAAEKAVVNFPSGGGSSTWLPQTFSDKAAGWYYIEASIGNSGIHQSYLIADVRNGADQFIKEIINVALPKSLISSNIQKYLVYIPLAFAKIRVRSTYDSGTAVFDLFSFSLKPFTPTDYTETLTFDVEDACDNPVLLMWKNSLGGDAFWMFDHSQEVGYNLSGSKKAKRMTLFAEHLTLNQWEALNELNTLGEVYAENIIEFTSSVNKTHKRDGAQVYVLDASGNKTGVIVIPTTSVINTKDETHSIEIEIELPQRIE
jgi:hypothetical protein